MALMSSWESSISLKLSRMRDGVTLLGMTECSPSCDQAMMTLAGVTPSFSAILLISGCVIRSGSPTVLLPKA